jgi:hypothetical protein
MIRRRTSPHASYHRRMMTNVTQLLSAVDQGDPHAASRLLPMVYDERRKLAAQRMAQERPSEKSAASVTLGGLFSRMDREEAECTLPFTRKQPVVAAVDAG